MRGATIALLFAHGIVFSQVVGQPKPTGPPPNATRSGPPSGRSQNDGVVSDTGRHTQSGGNYSDGNSDQRALPRLRYPQIPSSVPVPEKTLAAALEAEFLMTTNLVAKLSRALGTANSDVNEPLESIRTNATFLHESWQVWLKANSKEARKSVRSTKDTYWYSWHVDNLVLQKAEKAKLQSKADGLIWVVAHPGLDSAEPTGTEKKPGSKAARLIQEVAQDLNIKADNARHSADGLGREVLVKVRTKREGREIEAYEVWYVQRGMLDDKSFYTRFGKLSSPTEERSLCPGRYALWARKGKNEGEPATIRIPNQAGAHSEEIELDAP